MKIYIRSGIAKSLIVFFLLILFLNIGFSQQLNVPPYKDSTLTVAERTRDLLSRMTLEEKFWQLFMVYEDLNKDKSRYHQGVFGFEAGKSAVPENAAAQIVSGQVAGDAYRTAEQINQIQKFFVEKTRLGIPVIMFDEALHGLNKEGATVFPQSIALAATFDLDIMHRVAGVIALETRSMGIRQVLSPVVNIANDQRWGRTEETYGEDPFLSAEMGVAFTSEFEKQGVITTPKHFVANFGDGGRDSYPVHFSERLLEEVYFPPFKECILRGGSRSVMSSYNSLDGSPCSANQWLLNDKLKKEWKFKGFVISDAGATGGANVLHMTASDYPDATWKAVNRGQDVIFQTDYEHYKLFLPAFLDGRVRNSAMDSSVSRVLSAKFELGLFDRPYADPAEAHYWNGHPDHQMLALEAACKSIVLLKNEGNILPLKKTLKSIALIGTDATEARLGGYSGPGNRKVSIAEGIKNKLGPSTIVNILPGSGRTSNEYLVIPSSSLFTRVNNSDQPGLLGTYYNNIDFQGTPTVTRTDPEINFRWTLYSPHPDINYDWYSARWTGKLRAPVSGTFQIGLEGNDGYRLYVDGTLLIDNWQKSSYHRKMVDFTFVKDREYDICVEYYETVGNVWFRMIWNVGVENSWENDIKAALAAAESSEAIVMVAGIEEGEGLDRAYLNLPGHQEELILKLAETGKPMVVVLVGGSAITMNTWIDKVPGVLDVWYPGEQGGNAVANVLFGDYNPAGRLPVTFPVTEGQLPLFYYHKPTGRNDDYRDMSSEALFPFGHGLSYTRFEYSNPILSKREIINGDSLTFSFVVTNAGKTAGEEVTQLYIKDVLASVARPLRELKGFKRIYLEAGQSKTITFSITPRMLSMLDIHLKTVVEPGEFRLLVGSSSKDIRLRETFWVK